MTITLLLVDDHALVLGGLEQLLRSESGFEVLGTCSTLEEAWRALAICDPDVLLLDLMLREGDSLDLLRRLDGRPRPAVVVLTAVEDENFLLEAVRLGARGVVLKAMAPRVLEQCLRTVHAGSRWLQIDHVDLGERLVRRQRVETDLEPILTARELELLRLIALGLDNLAIAERLAISVGTVKIHLHHIYDKLRLPGRQGLQAFLREKQY